MSKIVATFPMVEYAENAIRDLSKTQYQVHNVKINSQRKSSDGDVINTLGFVPVINNLGYNSYAAFVPYPVSPLVTNDGPSSTQKSAIVELDAIPSDTGAIGALFRNHGATDVKSH